MAKPLPSCFAAAAFVPAPFATTLVLLSMSKVMSFLPDVIVKDEPDTLFTTPLVVFVFPVGFCPAAAPAATANTSATVNTTSRFISTSFIKRLLVYGGDHELGNSSSRTVASGAPIARSRRLWQVDNPIQPVPGIAFIRPETRQ